MKRVSLIIVMLALFSSVALAQLRLYTEVSPPMNYTNADGTPTGAAVEIVQEIMKITGDKAKIEVVPWARGYDEATNISAKDVALFSAGFNEQRRDLFKWVGPLAENNWVFYAPANSKIVINSLEDAKKVKSIGVYKGDVREQFLYNEGFNNLESVIDNSLNIKKLAAGRIDLWCTSDLAAPTLAKQEKIDFNLIKKVYTIRQTGLFIIFNKNTSDEIVNKWQKAYDTLKANGTLKKILAKYGIDEPTYKIPPRPQQ